MARTIDYGNLMHRAMRGLIQTVLKDVAAHGLPGAHHFFITFDTKCAGTTLGSTPALGSGFDAGLCGGGDGVV